MEQNNFGIHNNIILLEIVGELQKINNYIQDNLISQKINDIIMKINFVINENKKNQEIIMNQVSSSQNHINQINPKFQINNLDNIKEIKFKNGIYIGQLVNGVKEGKGIFHYNNGAIYEGEYKNNKKEGKGIAYYKNGEYL